MKQLTTWTKLLSTSNSSHLENQINEQNVLGITTCFGDCQESSLQFRHRNLNSPHNSAFGIFYNKVHGVTLDYSSGSIAPSRCPLAYRYSSPCNKCNSRNFCSHSDTACSTDRHSRRGGGKGSEAEEWCQLHDHRIFLGLWFSSRHDLNKKMRDYQFDYQFHCYPWNANWKGSNRPSVGVWNWLKKLVNAKVFAERTTFNRKWQKRPTLSLPAPE